MGVSYVVGCTRSIALAKINMNLGFQVIRQTKVAIHATVAKRRKLCVTTNSTAVTDCAKQVIFNESQQRSVQSFSPTYFMCIPFGVVILC